MRLTLFPPLPHSYTYALTHLLIRSLKHFETTSKPKIENYLATKSVIAVTWLMKLWIHKNKNANLLQSYKIRQNRWLFLEPNSFWSVERNSRALICWDTFVSVEMASAQKRYGMLDHM